MTAYIDELRNNIADCDLYKVDNSIINFGLNDDNLNWMLTKFIDIDTISSTNLNSSQIDALANFLDWKKFSLTNIPGESFIKYKNRIHWDIFLKTKHHKEAYHLLEVKDKVYSHRKYFYNPHKSQHEVKYFYDLELIRATYTSDFISAFTILIDWNLINQGFVQVEEYIILRYFKKLSASDICKNQIITPTIMRELKYYLDWSNIAKYQKLTVDLINEFAAYLDWNHIWERYNFDLSFAEKHIRYCNSVYFSKCQTISEKFILKHHKILNMPVISKYQKLSAAFIKKNHKLLDLKLLSYNANYNKRDTLQVVINDGVCYIIDGDTVTRIYL